LRGKIMVACSMPGWAKLVAQKGEISGYLFSRQMLGSRRASVSEAASALQKTGVISYTRGTVTIVDRKKLEKVACDCYGILIMQKRRWQTEAGG